MEKLKDLKPIDFEPLKTPITLEFSNIKVTVKKNKKVILNDCSACLRSGRLTAIIGSSGSGKTSLMSVLAGIMRSDRSKTVSGEIRVNGTAEFDCTALQRQMSYVMQDEPLYQFLNVRETMAFYAALKLPRAEDRAPAIERLLTAFSLESAAETLVGGDKVTGISGGEKKRLGIAKELISNPALIFLDEPTSGLDSYAEYKTVALLKSLALSGRTVVVSVHRPSSQVIALFDDLVLMSAGLVVYCGPMAAAIETLAGAGYPLPEQCNPADHFIYVTCPTDEADTARIERLAQTCHSVQKQKGPLPLASHSAVLSSFSNGKVLTSLPNQVFALISKQILPQYKRNITELITRLVPIVLLPLLCGSIFFRLDQGDKQKTSGALFFVLMNIVCNPLFAISGSIPRDQYMLKKEVWCNNHTAMAYYFSKMLLELCINVVSALFNHLVVYWMVGFENTARNFMIHFVVLLFALTIGIFLAMIIGVVSKTPEGSTNIVFLILIPMVLFSGFVMGGIFVRNISYINFFRYLLDILTLMELEIILLENDSVMGLWRLFAIAMAWTVLYFSVGMILYVLKYPNVRITKLEVQSNAKIEEV